METMGIPFDVILEQFSENNMVIDWHEFVATALSCGWTVKTLVTRVEYPMLEFLGQEAFERFKVLLAKTINSR